jgi:predicted ArsR family transcriptional regulator
VRGTPRPSQSFDPRTTTEMIALRIAGDLVSEMMRGLDQGLPAIGALRDGPRRRLYLFIREQTHPVSREEAAEAVGISPKLAAFHLDKLVEKKLLTATYGHPEGRPPSRVGRSSKLYEPSDLTLEVTVPERRYDLLADTLAEAVTSGGAEAVACAIAERRGVTVGRLAPAPQLGSALAAAVKVLSKHGFEPASDPGKEVLLLRNCPFHDVARGSPALVCQMNLAFVQGVLEGLGGIGLEARLDPAPSRCCVTLQPTEE